MSTIVRENTFVQFKYDHERRILMGTVKPILPTDDEWTFAKTTIRDFYDSALKTNTVFGMVLEQPTVPVTNCRRVLFPNKSWQHRPCTSHPALRATPYTPSSYGWSFRPRRSAWHDRG